MSLNIDIAAGLGGSGDPGGALAGGGTEFTYDHPINQSCRFENGDHLDKTYDSNEGNAKTWTFSAWVKRGSLGTAQNLFTPYTGGDDANESVFRFNTNNTIQIYDSGGTKGNVSTIRVFRDVGSWYHIVLALDLTLTNASERVKLYVNGELQNLSVTTAIGAGDWGWNNASKLHRLGGYARNTSAGLDGYMAEVYMIDGTALKPTSFAESVNGVWVPKAYNTADGAYGTHGFHLTFQGTGTATTTDGTTAQANIGDDQSGNGHNFAVTGLGSQDVVPDSPTNNYCTMNPLASSYISQITFEEGNLKCKNSTVHKSMWANFAVNSGKWYWEAVSAGSNKFTIGLSDANNTSYEQDGGTNNIVGYTPSSSYAYGDAVGLYAGIIRKNGSTVASSLGYATGDKMGIAFDADEGKVWFHKNGTWYNGSGTDSTTLDSSNHDTTVTTGKTYVPVFSLETPTTGVVNFGQDGSFATGTGGGNADENGHGDFFYAVPSGFLALCAANLPAPAIGPNQQDAGLQTIDNFETVLYTGTGGTQHIGSGGLQHPQDTASIANSLRFNEDSSLHYDITSSGNRRTWTFSAWVKRSELGASNGYYIFSDGESSNFSNILFNSSGKIYAQLYENTGSSVKQKTSTETFNKLNTWYHIVWRVDTTQATDSDRSRVYVNGTQITAWDSEQHVDQNDETTINVSGKDHLIGAYSTSSTSRHFSGYMAEINFTDGQSYGPENFGQIGSNGYWVPKTISGLTYGTNGFRLTFENSSYLGYDYQTSDRSGITNDFDTTDNIDAHDQVIDSPTQNFATWDPNNKYNYNAPTEGNLRALTSGNNGTQRSNVRVSSGKWYFEVRNGTAASGTLARFVGIAEDITTATPNSISANPYNNANNYLYYSNTGNKYNGGNDGSYGSTWQADGDVIGVAFDADIGAIWFSKNGTWQNSATATEIANGDVSNAAYTGLSGTFHFMVARTGGTSSNDPHHANFGQDPTFAGDETAPATDKTDSNGRGKFLYDVPTGFLAVLDDSVTQEGISKPDFVWIKERDANVHHYLFDTVRGPTTYVQSSVAHSTTEASRTDATTLISFDPQGFTVGSNGDVNGSGDSYVAWMWKAGGPSPTRTYTVKVDNDGGQNKYLFDGNTTIFAPTITLQPGGTYTFDQSDSSNTGHPLRFSTTSDGTHNSGTEYTTGVTTAGTPGTDGTTTIALASDAPTLYYYCTQHSGMGGQVTPNTKHGSSNFKGGKESIVTANQTAGFSIASYVGDHTAAGLSGRPVGHGLLKQTEFTLIKDRGNNSNNDNWSLSSTHIGDDYVYWTSMNPTGTAQVYPTTGDDETVTVGISGTTAATRTNNEDNHDFIMYNFHSVDGYCKLGSYKGRGAADGTFVYTGFKPRWIMIKCYEGTGNWFILDSVRSDINEMDDRLDADNYNDEDTANADIDFLSNGFKIRTASTAGINQDGDSHFFIAFAECPFRYANAR